MFALQKTSAGRKQLDDEARDLRTERLRAMELRIAPSRQFVLVETRREEGKDRVHCFFGSTDNLKRASRFEAAPSRWEQRLAKHVPPQWRRWSRIEDLATVESTLDTLLGAGLDRTLKDV